MPNFGWLANAPGRRRTATWRESSSCAPSGGPARRGPPSRHRSVEVALPSRLAPMPSRNTSVMNALKERLAPETFALFDAIFAAINDEKAVARLETFPAWRDQPPGLWTKHAEKMYKLITLQRTFPSFPRSQSEIQGISRASGFQVKPVMTTFCGMCAVVDRRARYHFSGPPFVRRSP